MDDELMQDFDQGSARRERRRRWGVLGYVLATVVAAALVMAGVVIGRITAASGGDDNASSVCTQAEKSLKASGQRTRTLDKETDSAEIRSEWRYAMTVVVQNPDCFPPGARAAAQNLLDKLDQQDDVAALCAAIPAAPGVPWWDRGC